MATTPDIERDNLIRGIGECIVTWAMVERGLTVLYCECVGFPVGDPDFWLHASVFDTVISIDTRLTMVQSALGAKSTRLTTPEMTTSQVMAWKKLRKKIRKGYDKRNQVAHSDVTQRGMEDGSQLVRLLPFPTLSTGSFASDQKSLNVEDLRERKREFEQLSGEIMKFREQIRAVTPKFAR
jgi:hypothetical protein